MTAQSGLTLEQALIAFFRSKQMLLVVDNCEHVLEAAAELVEQIESASADVVVLTTAREGLAIDGERLLPVPSLPDRPDADRDVAARSDGSGCSSSRAGARPRLRAQREQRGRSGAGVPAPRRLTAGDRTGRPRIPTMRPSELAIALDRRLDVLAGGRRRAVKRHQTLRATIDWSHELLNEGQRRLLARLSVFAGGCTREAAEAVCGAEPLDPRYGVRTPRQPRRPVAGRHRTRRPGDSLPTARDDPRVRGGTPRGARRGRAPPRSAHSLLPRRRRSIRRARLGPDQLVCGRRLESEHDNLLAAWSWALDTEDVGTAFRILSYAIPGAQIGYELWLPCDALPRYLA